MRSKGAVSTWVIVSVALAMSLAGCTSPTAIASHKPFDNAAASRQVVRCLAKSGISAKYDPVDGSINFAVPPSQGLAAERDLADCKAQAGFPLKTPELTNSQLNQLYKLTAKEVSCLASLGYHIPPIPSEQTFADQYETKPYVPYGYLPQLSQKQQTVVERKCPQPDV